jgi:hypothetical protein
MDTLPLFDLNDKPSEKRCTKCKQWFPATTEFFYCYKRGGDALRPTCKACTPNKTPAPDVSDKQCSRCKKVFPATPEFFHRNGVRGLYTQCKTCRSEIRNAAYRNPETHDRIRSKEKARRSIPENKAKAQASNKKWRERPESKEYLSNYHKKFRKEYLSNPENRERRRLADAEYNSRPEVKARRLERERASMQIPEIRERHRERDRVNHHTRRSRKKTVQGMHTTEQIQEQLKRQKYRCYYAACGHAKFKKEDGKYLYHIEHTFPISRVGDSDIPANDISYLVLACPACNMSKGDKFPWEWIEGGRLF